MYKLDISCREHEVKQVSVCSSLLSVVGSMLLSR